MNEKTILNIQDLIRKHENSIHTGYSGDEYEKLSSIIHHYENSTISAIADKKQMIDDTLVYFRSVAMISESIGMAGTHAEKAARLRGLIELLNSAIGKLKESKEEALLHHSGVFNWDYQDYPYRNLINKYRDLKEENERLKKGGQEEKNIF